MEWGSFILANRLGRGGRNRGPNRASDRGPGREDNNDREDDEDRCVYGRGRGDGRSRGRGRGVGRNWMAHADYET